MKRIATFIQSISLMAFAILLSSPSCVSANEIPQEGDESVSTPVDSTIVIERNMMMAMRDGV